MLQNMYKLSIMKYKLMENIWYIKFKSQGIKQSI